LAFAFVHFRETATPRRTSRFQVSPPGESGGADFKISPDGRYLAIVATEKGRNMLWVRPMDSLQAQPLTGTEDAIYPFWSPDSASIAFFAQGKLKKIALRGGPPQILCDARGGRGGAWNSDGMILFAPDLTGGLYRDGTKTVKNCSTSLPIRS
jgi:eukaryotic-like serine/threonine-protein kinase